GGTMRVARPWPGCHGRMTVGTAQTGKPRVSSANTAARLPTEPRTTWLETTMTARAPSVPALPMRLPAAKKEYYKPDDQSRGEEQTEGSTDAGAEPVDLVFRLAVLRRHVAAHAAGGPRQKGAVGLLRDAIENAPRFLGAVLVLRFAHVNPSSNCEYPFSTPLPSPGDRWPAIFLRLLCAT